MQQTSATTAMQLLLAKLDFNKVMVLNTVHCNVAISLSRDLYQNGLVCDSVAGRIKDFHINFFKRLEFSVCK